MSRWWSPAGWRMPWRRNRPLDCAEVGRVLQQFLDGELDEHRRHLVHDHLEDCVRCGLEAEVYERIKVALAVRDTTIAGDDPVLHRLHDFAAHLVRGDERDDEQHDGDG